jgi:streptogramin lyase
MNSFKKSVELVVRCLRRDCRPAPWLCIALLNVAAQAASDYSTPYDFTTLAGVSSLGSSDGPGNLARFFWPSSVAVDTVGNIYVADQKNNTIRKITPAGIVSTLAGTPGVRGSADGTGSAALFANPEGVAVDRIGNVYVTDKLNCTIRKISPDGVVTTIAGMAGTQGSTDGTGSDARFCCPAGIAVDPAGNIYVADWLNNTIRKITPAGAVSTLAGTAGVYGRADGTGSAAEFFYPFGLAIDASGNIFAAENGNDAVRKITPAGVVTTVLGTEAPVYTSGVAVDSSGNIFITDSCTIRKITPDGSSIVLAGAENTAGSADGVGSAAQFLQPFGLAVDAAGNIIVADRDSNTIRKVTPDGVVTTLAGLAWDKSFGSNDGDEFSARFGNLASAAVAPSGDVYVADALNSVVRKISPSGVVTTVAGVAGQQGNTDGRGSAARFVSPYGIAVDRVGNAYVADPGNDSIRKIDSNGDVTTFAGIPDGSPGSTDGDRSVARFAEPSGITIDGAGNIFVADTGNHTIRKVSPAGEVTTLAGSAGYPGSVDGTGSSARFLGPTGITAGDAGALYVTDTGNHLIRKISPDGTVSTLAGSVALDPNTDGTDGTGGAARFKNPYGIAADSAGNVYVADSGNNTIRRITSAGVVSTLAGFVAAPGHADGTGKNSRFLSPPGVSLDSHGILYVTSGTTVRKGQLAGPPLITTQPQSQQVTFRANVQFSATASGVPAPTYQWYFNGNPFNGATSNTLSFTNARSSDAGDYTVVVTNSLGRVTSNPAVLTVSAVPAPTPAPTGSGGGAIGAWLVLALLGLGAARRLLSTPPRPAP